VAETKTTLQQIGLTRGKAMLIGLLALVLLGVLYRQFGVSDAGDAASVADGKSRQRPRPVAASPSTLADEQEDGDRQIALAEFDQARWKAPALSEVIAYDPFALPAAFPQPPRVVVDSELTADRDTAEAALNAQKLAEAVEQMERQLEELQQRGVRVIVNLRDEYVALVGDRTLRVGDEINGFIVTAIEPDGVSVERKGLE
jgi:hypothetical protein